MCPLQVASSHRSHKLLLVLLHLPDEGLITGFFVLSGPKNHFGQDGSEIEALGRQHVSYFSAIGGVFLRCDDAMSYQFFQAISQDVRGDSFVGLEEFFVTLKSAQHHVPQDQQRPAIAEHFDGCVEWASGPALRSRLLGGHRGY